MADDQEYGDRMRGGHGHAHYGPRGPRGHPGPAGVVDETKFVLRADFDALQEKVKRLEEMVEALWDAPNMPGAKQLVYDWDRDEK